MSSNPRIPGPPLRVREEREFLADDPFQEAVRAYEEQLQRFGLGQASPRLPDSSQAIADLQKTLADLRRRMESELTSTLPTTAPARKKEFLRAAAAGLGHRAWMLDELASAPFLLEADLSELPMSDPREGRTAHEIRFDVSPFLEREVEPSRLVLLALYPSGAVRGLSATVERNGGTWVSLNDPSALLDPDLDSPSTRCQVKLAALETPAA